MQRFDLRRTSLPLVGAVLALALVLTPGRADAQFSGVSAGNFLENAPMFTHSALVHEQGGASFGGYFAWFMLDEEEIFGDEDGDITAYQAGAGAAFGITDRITVGATLPYISISEETEFGDFDASGIGDLTVFGRAQLWRSANMRSRVAALASVDLPTMSDELIVGDDEDIEIDRSPDFSIGGAVSHDANRASLHGSIEYTVGGDLTIEDEEFDGIDVLSFSAAAVFSASERMKVIGEVQVDSPREDDVDTESAVAGGLRYLASPNLFLDGGVVVPVSEDDITAILFAGLTWTR